MKMLLKELNSRSFRDLWMFLFVSILTTSFGVVSTFAQTKKILVEDPSAIIDILIEDQNVIYATDVGSVRQYSLKSRHLNNVFTFPKIVDYFGDSIDAVVHSIDRFPGEEEIYAVVQGKSAYRDLYQIKGGKVKKLIDAQKDRFMIARVYACGGDYVAFITLGNEFVKLDVKAKKVVLRKTVNTSVHTYSTWNTNRKFIFVADESGRVSKVDVNNGNIDQIIEIHKDYIYSLSADGDYLISGSKDKYIAVVSNLLKDHYLIDNKFPVYAVAVHSQGNKLAYLKNDQSIITVTDIIEKAELNIESGHDSIINEMGFHISGDLITSGLDGKLIKWEGL